MFATSNIRMRLNALVFLVLLPFSSMADLQSTHLQSAKLFALLPDNCPTPDAFAIAPDGSLTLSCPNYANNKLQGELLSISSKGKVSHLVSVPRLNLNTKANPMGIAYDEQGALYVADARGIKNGRILKLTFTQESQTRTLTSTEVIVSGINPNGLRYHQGGIYITQLKMPKIKSKKMTSGIYRFNVTDRNLKMTNTLKDEQLIFSIETQNPNVDFGLDGLDFDHQGHLFTAVLGDGKVYKLTLDKNGQVTNSTLFASVPKEARIDGIVFDKHNNLYLAGFGLNQIYKITPQKEVIKLADYPDNDGSHGQIDQPADLMIYQNKLVISNFDLMKGNGIRNSKHSKPYTLSYIDIH